MLPRKHRLRRRRDFNRVYRKGIRLHSRHLTLRAYKLTTSPTNDESPTQVGISISTKVNKRATVRNRIKRQIKAAMFHLLPKIAGNWLIIVSVRPGTIECDYWQFLRELEEMIKKLR